MSQKKRLEKAPYNSLGGLMSYVAYPEIVHEWRENKPFPAWLTLTGTTRGRSAARFAWRCLKDRTYEMFMTDMVDLVKRAPSFTRGQVCSWWVVQRRGQNYGIRLATLDELIAIGEDVTGLGLPPYPSA